MRTLIKPRFGLDIVLCCHYARLSPSLILSLGYVDFDLSVFSFAPLWLHSP